MYEKIIEILENKEHYIVSGKDKAKEPCSCSFPNRQGRCS